MGKKKHVAEKSESKDSGENKDFSLEEVIKLGGEKKDYEWLLDLDDNAEVVDKEDVNADPIKKDELRDFVKQLGFYKLKVDDESDDITEGVKLAKRPLTEEERQEHEVATTSKVKDKKKKTKNKFKVQDEEVSSTTVESAMAIRKPEQMVSRKNMLIKLGGKWYDHQFSDDPDDFDAVDTITLNRLQAAATKLLDADVALYKKQQEKSHSSDANWMRTVLNSGTLGDKMAALTLLIQDAPIHNLASLENLIGMMGKKGRREALMAADTLKELFMNDLLLDDRKLQSFDQHPLSELDDLTSGNRDSRDRRLIMWHFEASLRDKYSQFVTELEKLAQDNIADTKRKVLSTVHELLANKPEQEKRLLAILVNKLGDPDHKIASKSSYLLTRLVERHPNMKMVVTLEVERLLYRPNVSPKAQYYGVCFLHSLYLNKEDKDLEARLVTLYFTFFQTYVKKGEVDSKMLRALLTGVNRAYPFAKVDREKMSAQMDTLYRVVHLVNFNTGLQALMLLYQVMEIEDSTADRFYMALYRKLVDPDLQNSAHQPLFLNLLFKALRKDTVECRVKAFVKRLLQMCCYMSPTFVCGALSLLSELMKTKRGLLTLSRSATMASIQGESDDDEDEHFVDAPEDDLEDQHQGHGSDKEEPTLPSKHQGHTTAPSWVHRANLKQGRGSGGLYDALHRNPLHCHADTECVWEVETLTQHFHPSVSLFAKTILKGEHISYPGNPLHDFTLVRFLDRFVYRNPKPVTKGQESSADHRAYRRAYNPSGLRALPVNSEEYLLSGRDKIPADEMFFFQYFTQHANRKQAQQSEDMDSDDDSVADDEFEEFLNKYEGGMDEKDVDFDFAGEFSKQASSKDKKKKKGDDDESSDDGADLSDEEVDIGADEALRREFEQEMAGAQEAGSGEELEGEPGFDEEDVEFSDDEDDEPLGASGKHKFDEDSFDEDEDDFDAPSAKRKKKGGKDDLASLFASADEFAHLLDDTGEAGYDMGTSSAVAVKDKADIKQLQWEEKREKKFQGQGRKGKHSKGAPKHKVKGGFKAKGRKCRK